MSVVFHRDFSRNLERLDGSVKARAWDFVTKLSADPHATGLDLKMPKAVGDRRVRTARVNDQFRAVLFVVGEGEGASHVVVTILNHDDAYAYASTATMQVNPSSGAVELGTATPEPTDPTPPPPTPAPARPRSRALPEPQQCLPFSVAELTALGVEAETAQAAIALTDEADLLTLIDPLPSWQAAVLLDLATGRSLDEVRSDYVITHVPTEHVDADETLRTALARPSSQMEFATVDDDELQRMIGGEFAEWRVFLHPRQRALAYRETYNGPARVSGGAGTGKTVVALHRAVYLARANPGARVLLATFNRTLAAALEADLHHLGGAEIASRVDVLGVDQLARATVIKAGGHVGDFLGDRDVQDLWDEACSVAGASAGLSPAFLHDEYVSIVLAQGVMNEAQYLKVARRGRSHRLNRQQRTVVWGVIERYRALLRERGATTFADLAATAAELLDQGSGPTPVYDHAVIDEGQDLHAAHWRLLRAMVVPAPNDVFICEDSHQRIYGRKVVLSRLGIETRGRSRRLTLNYRTTERILTFSLRLLRGEPVTDLDGERDTTAGYVSLRRGRTPELHGFTRRELEWQAVAEQVLTWQSAGADAPGEIGVLVRRSRDASTIAERLRRLGLGVRLVTSTGAPGTEPVRVMTMHRAKGSEFARCIVAGVSETIVPEPTALKDLDGDELADAIVRERLLLYVACTRARDELTVTWTGPPSPFLAGVPRAGAD